MKQQSDHDKAYRARIAAHVTRIKWEDIRPTKVLIAELNVVDRLQVYTYGLLESDLLTWSRSGMNSELVIDDFANLLGFIDSSAAKATIAILRELQVMNEVFNPFAEVANALNEIVGPPDEPIQAVPDYTLLDQRLDEVREELARDVDRFGEPGIPGLH